jgi:hypothetical protein
VVSWNDLIAFLNKCAGLLLTEARGARNVRHWSESKAAGRDAHR